MVDLVIIGGGPAGLAAACKAWESGLRDILILERDKELGGILNQCIHNGFWSAPLWRAAHRPRVCRTLY